MQRAIKALFIVFISCNMTIAVHAVELSVPSPLYPTIQAAVTAAASGDTISLSGVNTSNLTGAAGKRLTFTSANLSAPATLIIETNRFVFTGAANSGSIITSLILTGGTANTGGTGNNGGAVFNNSSAAAFTIGNTTFLSNSATSAGGAIYNNGANATLDAGNIFNLNTAGTNGGAISNAATAGTMTITANTFTNNSSTGSGAGVSGGGAIYNNGTLILNGANNFTSNSAAVQGGAIYNNAGSTLTINPGSTFTSNTSDTFGGAISNNGADAIATIDGATFTGNKAIERAGAVYNQSSTATSAQITISNSLFENNSTGTPTSQLHTPFGGGAIYNYNNARITLDSGNTFSENSTPFSGGAIFNIGGTNGTGTVIINAGNTFSGNSAGQYGGAIFASTNSLTTLNSTGGTILFSGNSAALVGINDVYLNDTAILDITGSGSTVFEDGIAGSATAAITQSGSGDLILGSNSLNSDFGGTFTQTAGTTTLYSNNFFGGTNNISNSAINLFSPTRLTMLGDSFNLDNAHVNAVNNSINAFLVTNMNVTGVNNFSIDINAATGASDSFNITNLTGNGMLNISSLNVLGAPTAEVVSFNIFNVTNNLSTVSFNQSVGPINTPIFRYGFRSDGNGQFSLFRQGFDPAVFRGQVSTLAQYNSVLTTNGMIFDHIYLDSPEFIASSFQNKYAYTGGMFAPYQFGEEEGGVWVKGYANFERLFMTQDLDINNTLWGSIVGVDFDARRIGRGWQFMPTVFLNYAGGSQHFDGVSMQQNGGRGGFMGTFRKRNFIGSIMAYGGGYQNEMLVGGFRDKTGNWFAGTAAKAAYNFRPTHHLVLQPSVLASYNIFGEQNWHSDFGALSMNAGFLNGINVAPGLNVIYAQEAWTAYFTSFYMWNINDQIGGRAGGVNLPGVSMRHGWLEYGVGMTRNFKERFMGYFQTTVRNGGRLGVALQAGLTWKF